MRNFPATVVALAILIVWQDRSIAAPVTNQPPFVLLPPYSTISAGGRSSKSVSVYKIDAPRGVPKRVPGSPFAAARNPGAGALAPGERFAHAIDATNGGLTPLTGSLFAVAATNTDAIARWFDAGRCVAFDRGWADGPLVAKRDSEGVIFDPITAGTRGYFYDPKSRFALYYPQRDSEGTFTLRLSGPPPAGVPRHDLSKLHTASGITLGSTSAMVVRLLGKPEIVKKCGLTRYIYQRSAEGEPTSLQFTIDKGRVIEIFEDFSG